MKQERNFPSVVITRKAENAARAGHPWVYAEEITERRGELRQGCIADVFSQKGAWLGAGFYSETSKIGVRILSDNANESFGPEFSPSPRARTPSATAAPARATTRSVSS